MAHKRRITIGEREPVAEDEGRSQELGWKDWLLRRYARSWYWVGALFLDVILFFEAQWSFGLDLFGASALAALALLIELYIFIKIWGRNGPLGNRDDGE
jgi:hypothetical protein